MTTKELMSWISSGSETPYEVTGAEIQSILDAERTKAIKTYAENHPRADEKGLRDEAEEFRSDNMNLRKKLHLFLECERLSIRRPLAEALEIAEKADDEGF
ncbi:MAG: hypothetical protein FJ088_13110, partial [Deltaproteobacteria bacterium]|nr:hypothetical protein [Deltaproteobacteria bacterium]